MLNRKPRKCYKLDVPFDAWEEIQEDGSICTYPCPFVSLRRGEFKLRCNGLNEFGQPCWFSESHQIPPKQPPDG
jgi:hypothetical protein